MFKRLIYDIEMWLLNWLQDNYVRPRTVNEYMIWYPKSKIAREEVLKLARKHFGDLPVREQIKHDHYCPWLMELWIEVTLPEGISVHDVLVKDRAFLHEWVNSPAYYPDVHVSFEYR